MDIGNLESLVSLLALGITYLIVQPLKVSIEGLKEAMVRFTNTLNSLQEETKAAQLHIAQIDEKTRSVSHEVEGLEKRLRDVEQRCVNCTCRKE